MSPFRIARPFKTLHITWNSFNLSTICLFVEFGHCDVSCQRYKDSCYYYHRKEYATFDSAQETCHKSGSDVIVVNNWDEPSYLSRTSSSILSFIEYNSRLLESAWSILSDRSQHPSSIVYHCKIDQPILHWLNHFVNSLWNCFQMRGCMACQRISIFKRCDRNWWLCFHWKRDTCSSKTYPFSL